MTQDELLRHVVSVLEELKLRYFVTGSIASIYYGEPRLTNDIDIVVDLPEHSIPELCAAFPAAEFYLSDEAAAWKAQDSCRRSSRACFDAIWNSGFGDLCVRRVGGSYGFWLKIFSLPATAAPLRCSLPSSSISRMSSATLSS